MMHSPSPTPLLLAAACCPTLEVEARAATTGVVAAAAREKEVGGLVAAARGVVEGGCNHSAACMGSSCQRGAHENPHGKHAQRNATYTITWAEVAGLVEEAGMQGRLSFP